MVRLALPRLITEGFPHPEEPPKAASRRTRKSDVQPPPGRPILRDGPSGLLRMRVSGLDGRLALPRLITEGFPHPEEPPKAAFRRTRKSGIQSTPGRPILRDGPSGLLRMRVSGSDGRLALPRLITEGFPHPEEPPKAASRRTRKSGIQSTPGRPILRDGPSGLLRMRAPGSGWFGWLCRD